MTCSSWEHTDDLYVLNCIMCSLASQGIIFSYESMKVQRRVWPISVGVSVIVLLHYIIMLIQCHVC